MGQNWVGYKSKTRDLKKKNYHYFKELAFLLYKHISIAVIASFHC